MAAFIEAASAEAERADARGGRTEGAEAEHELSDGLVDLLDSAFLDSFGCAPRLLELLEERGWTGWTMIRRREPERPSGA